MGGGALGVVLVVWGRFSWLRENGRDVEGWVLKLGWRLVKDCVQYIHTLQRTYIDIRVTGRLCIGDHFLDDAHSLRS